MKSEDNNLNFLTYSEAYKKGADEVGGKAFSIARLSEKGINVPRGIILNKNIWKYFERNKDEQYLNELVENITEYMKAEKYVVRSSAIGEDSGEYSWAGCFESILNINKEKISEAIIECGQSLYGERVKAYKRLHENVVNIEDMGILIQQYIDADWSGVCFSSNPVTGDNDECIIEYQKGKSGSVVGGYGEPTTLIINKEKMDFQYEELDLSKETINLILEKMKQIVNIWNMPVDIEWVIKDNDIYITQTRPITTI